MALTMDKQNDSAMVKKIRNRTLIQHGYLENKKNKCMIYKEF